LWEAGRGPQGPHFTVRDKDEERPRAKLPGKRVGVLAPAVGIGQRIKEDARLVRQNRYSGKTQTTAVQLWKPSNWPSARAI
jgi:hypothetical protein